MKDGYYLSVYTCINPISYYYNIPLRHDHNMALWKLTNNRIDLIHYWEFERITGLKKHDKSFFCVDDANEFINNLLVNYNLSMKDMNAIWGTPGIATKETYVNKISDICMHSIYHLYSSLFMNSYKYRESNIIALAFDAGPDNLQEMDANFKNFYAGAYSCKGDISFFSISSPACLWSQLASAVKLQEGTLMALGTATCSEMVLPNNFIPKLSIYNYIDTYLAANFINKLVSFASNLSKNDIGSKVKKWDNKFGVIENRISMMVKVLQKISVNMVVNEVKKIVNKYNVDTSDTILAISGGYGLNCPTNSILIKHFGFKELQGVPCISDCGISLGIGLYEFFSQSSNYNFRLINSYYGDSDVQFTGTFKKYSHYIKKINDFDKKQFVNDIESGPVIWFYGRSEIGPRSLGHRSILGDPRNPQIKERLNRIKGRQWWRPVAPMIIENEVDKWFEDDFKSEYMLMIYKIKRDKAKMVPSILHIDGTARVQTVTKDNAMLYEILKIFAEFTGVPMLCNTSLNDKGEPIINSTNELFNFALRKKIKIAYIDKKRVELNKFYDYKNTEPQQRYKLKNHKINEKFLNPYGLNKDEIEFYLYNAQLRVFDLKKEDEVKYIRKIICKLKGKNEKSNS